MIIRCPLALRLVNLADVDGSPFARDRWISGHHGRTDDHAEDDCKEGISSLMGLVSAASGCPHTSALRPMARFHLPLARNEETVHRATSMYLLAQFFLKKEGAQTDLELDGITRFTRTCRSSTLRSPSGRARRRLWTPPSMRSSCSTSRRDRGAGDRRPPREDQVHLRPLLPEPACGPRRQPVSQPLGRWRPHPWHGLEVGPDPPGTVHVFIEIPSVPPPLSEKSASTCVLPSQITRPRCAERTPRESVTNRSEER